MGVAAAEVADLVVVTDDNPRSEDPAAIRAAILEGVRGGARRRPSARGARGGRPAGRHPRGGRRRLGPGRGRHGRRRGQGPRDRPGRRRGRAPLRRPRRAARRPCRHDGRGGCRRDRAVAHRGRAGHRWLRRGAARRRPGCRRRRRPGRHRLARVRPRRALRRPRRRARRRPRLRRRRRRARRGRRAGHPPGRGRALRRRRRHPGRASPPSPARSCDRLPGTWPSSGITGSSGKTSTKDLLGTVLRHGRADGRPGGVVQLRGGRAAHGLPGHRRHPLPRRRDGRPRHRPHRLPRPAWRPRGSASCSTSAPRTSASSARARPSPPPSPSWPRRCPAEGLAVLNADDPRRARPWRGCTTARVVLVGEADDADVRATDVTLDGGGRASFTVARPAGQPRRARSGWSGEHHVGNALAVVAVGHRARHVARVGRRRTGVRTTGQPLADGGRRARRRRHRGQRRLQRQPRLDARRARGARARWAEGRRTWAVLGDDARARRRVRRAARRGRRGGRRTRCRRARRRRRGRRGTGRRRARGGPGIRRPPAPTCGRCRTPTPPQALLDAELRPGDVVLFKSSRDAGLRLLGDRLAGPREELT